MTQDEQEYQEYLEYQEYQKYQQARAAQQQQAAQAEAPDRPFGEGMSAGRRVWEEAKGAADTATSFLSGAAAEPLAGLAGLGTLAVTWDNDKANEAIEWTRQALTKEAWSEAGERNQEAIGKVAAKVEPYLLYADDAIGKITGGDPLLASALKTAVFGAAELVGVGKAKGLAKLGDVASDATQVRNQAIRGARQRGEAAGLVYTNDDLPGSVVNTVNRLTDVRTKGGGTELLQDAVQSAEAKAKANVDKLYSDARNKRAFADVRGLRQAGERARQQMISDGVDVREHATLQTRLNQIEDMDLIAPGSRAEQNLRPGFRPDRSNPHQPTISRLSLRNLDIMDKRLTADLAGVNPKNFNAEQRALYNLRKELRNELDSQVNAKLITGDQTALKALKDAKAEYATYKKNFNADRTIKKLVERDATAEDTYRWLMGASAANLKVEAAKTIATLKNVLGPDHPTLKTLKMAALRDAFEPLLAGADIGAKEFGQAARKVDRMLRENTSVLKELGVDTDELHALRDGMRIAAETQGAWKWDWTPLTAFVARESLGNRLAKSAAHQRIMTKSLNYVLRVGKLSQREINKMLLDQPYNKPLIMPNYPGYKEVMGQIMSSGARADMLDPQAEGENEEE